jgi:hypothetical protein
MNQHRIVTNAPHTEIDPRIPTLVKALFQIPPCLLRPYSAYRGDLIPGIPNNPTPLLDLSG